MPLAMRGFIVLWITFLHGKESYQRRFPHFRKGKSPAFSNFLSSPAVILTSPIWQVVSASIGNAAAGQPGYDWQFTSARPDCSRHVYCSCRRRCGKKKRVPLRANGQGSLIFYYYSGAPVFRVSPSGRNCSLRGARRFGASRCPAPLSAPPRRSPPARRSVRSGHPRARLKGPARSPSAGSAF